MIRARRALTVLPVALALACATGPRSARGADWITVQVQNDLIPASPVVVHMIGDGRRVLLGDVPPAVERTLVFHETTFRGMYSLEATARASTVQSQAVALRPGDTVVWQLRSNLVQIRTRDDATPGGHSSGQTPKAHGTTSRSAGGARRGRAPDLR
jgi:hypothetical protein